MLHINRFSGVAPVLTRWQLPAHLAQTASNVNLESRTVKPWRDPLTVLAGQLSGATTSIYRFGLDLVSDTQYWFVKSGDVDFVKGPLVADQTERTIFTGDSYPKWTNNTLALTGSGSYPINYRRLGLPAPLATPSGTATGSVSTTDFEYWAYRFTRVTAYGEESGPSPISEPVRVLVGQTVNVTGFGSALTGDESTTAIRLYRSVVLAGQVSPQFFFVKEVAEGTSTIADDVGDDVGDLLETDGWERPPTDGFGACAMANGIIVMFSGYDVCPSEQYAPYAYKQGNRLSTDYEIVGGAPLGNEVVVLTTGNPYVLSGTSTESLSLRKVHNPQACVSKRSIANVGDAIVYASPDGLCAIDAAGNVAVLTGGLLSRDDWQALVPSSIHGYLHNGKYIGFYNTGSTTGSFVFDPKQGDAALSYSTLHATGGYCDLVQDHLYLHIGTDIKRWDAAGTKMTGTWKSGVVREAKPRMYDRARVRASAYPVTLKVYAAENATPLITKTVADSAPFRLPRYNKTDRHEVQLETAAGEVYEVFAGSLEELRGLE